MRAIIEDMVAIAMPAGPFNVDWSGPQGRQIADDALRRAYEAFESRHPGVRTVRSPPAK
jgi:hypothetical protein